MNIDDPLRELGEVDSTALRERILSQDEPAWHEDDYRQQQYDVHRETESIVMVFTNGKNWPNSEIRKEPGWDRLADVAVPMMHEIPGKHDPPGGTITSAIRFRLRQLGRNDEIFLTQGFLKRHQ